MTGFQLLAPAPVKAQDSDVMNRANADKDEKIDPLKELFRYELPQWLREEFKASEILLYEHHFSLIDVDNGGSYYRRSQILP